MVRKEMLLIFAVLVFLMGAVVASAASDVAYVYRKSFRIDYNVIDVFNDAGLSVDLINEDSLPIDFSSYRLIFVGDEVFTKDHLIPVNDFPSVISNYYHADDWGFTDSEGVSQLASNRPLSVVKDGQVIQVYTSAGNGIGGPALPYYFLDSGNKAPSLETVAFTETTSSGSDFGDVISTAEPGDLLANGQTQNAKLCFFGIIESDFWTPAARVMFQECVSHVVSTCQVDNDCSGPALTGEPFCQSGDVYQNERSFSCQNGGLEAQCVPADSSVLIDDCQYGCFEGSCVIPDCLDNSDCGVDGFVSGEFCSQDDVARTFESFVCNNPGGSSSFCSSSTEDRVIKMCSDICVAGECVVIECTFDSDCGTDDYVGGEFCSVSDDVVRDFETFTCNNPGNVSSFCSSEKNEELIEQCSDVCVAGECRDFECSFDSDCNDFNPLTLDKCINPSSVISECRNTPVNCNNDNDCGFTGFVGVEFCSEENVAKNFQTSTCNNPGNTTSFCEVSISSNTIASCDFACSDGACVRCDSNLDCDDSDSATVDSCVNPGTLESFCNNGGVTCTENSDCGVDGLVGAEFCSASGDVAGTFESFTCNNPGNVSSFCSSNLSEQFIQECSSSCVNGACEDITCTLDSECDDLNPLTLDQCLNAGTVVSECRNTPVNCNSNNDCGINGFVGSEFCSQDDVAKNFQTSTCINPGQTISFCEISVSSDVLASCDFACSDGACVRCDENLDCDDSDSATADICYNPGTLESFCDNEDLTPEIACTVNADCGEDLTLSEPFCSVNNVKELVLNWDCNNPGTTSSFCSSTMESELIEVCSEFCSEGSCVEIECFEHIDCVDGNNLTLDVCNEPGTTSSFCSNPPIDVICFEDSDCGTDGQIGGDFCSGDEITNLFLGFDCNNPGTAGSFCSSTLTQETTEICEFACSGGTCIPEPPVCGNGVIESGETCDDGVLNGLPNQCNLACSGTSDPVCGNEVVEAGESCDDGNLINGDGCSSVCTIDNCSPGETRDCGLTDVGLCEFGTETCGVDGFFGECVGEVGPALEICDDEDNNCDGFIDEGGVCEVDCTDECVADTQVCVSDGAFKFCALTGNGCTEWSLDATCDFGLSCSAGECVLF